MRVYQKHAGDDAKLLIKFHWPYSVVCVHYGDPRSRGKNIRPNQRTFAMNCNTKITVSYIGGGKGGLGG